MKIHMNFFYIYIMIFFTFNIVPCLCYSPHVNFVWIIDNDYIGLPSLILHLDNRCLVYKMPELNDLKIVLKIRKGETQLFILRIETSWSFR